jgi:hypothetical protein
MSFLSRLFRRETTGPAQNAGVARSVGTGYQSPFSTRQPRTWDDVVKSITGSVQPEHRGSASQAEHAAAAHHSAAPYVYGPDDGETSQSGSPAHTDLVRKIFGPRPDHGCRPLTEPTARREARGESTDD